MWEKETGMAYQFKGLPSVLWSGLTFNLGARFLKVLLTYRTHKAVLFSFKMGISKVVKMIQ